MSELKPPVFEESLEKTLMAKIIFVLAPYLFCLRLFGLVHHEWIEAWVLGVYIASTFLLIPTIWLCARRHVGLASYLFIANLAIVEVWRFNMNARMFQDVALILFPITLALGALLFRRWTFTAFACVMIGGLVILAAFGRSQLNPLLVPALCITALCIGILSRALRVTWDRSQKLQAERRAVEEIMRLQSAALQAAANSVVICDRAGTIVWSNAAFTRMTGYSHEELLGQNTRILKSPRQNPEIYRILWATISQGKVWHGEIVNQRKNGENYVEDMTVTPVTDPSGTITHFIAVKEDITERKAAEAEHREAEQRLHLSLDAAGMGLWERNLLTGVLTWSSELQKLLKYAPKDLTFDSYSSLVHPEDKPCLLEKLTETIQNKTEFSVEYRLNLPDGRTMWIASRGRAVCDELGNPAYLTGLCQDITQRKTAEESLRQAELKFRTLFEQSPFGVVTHDAETFLPIEFNDAVCQQLGYTREEFANLPITSYNVTYDAEGIRKNCQTLFAKKFLTLQVKHRKKSGELLDVVVSLKPLVLHGRKMIHAILRDVTEQNRVEQARRVAELKFRALFERSPMGVALFDPETWLPVEFNDMACEQLGYTRAEYSQLRIPDYDCLLSVEEIRATVRQVLSPSGIAPFKTKIRTKGGRVRDVEIRAKALTIEGRTLLHCIINDVTEREDFERGLQQTQMELRALYTRIVSLREDERKMLSRDLHDQAGQLITALRHELSSLERHIQKVPDPQDRQRLSDRLHNSLQLLSETHTSLINAATALRPAGLTGSLVETLKSELRKAGETYAWTCTLSLPDGVLPIKDSEATVLFRIFQEGLTNIARHAKATSVNLSLVQNDGWLRLTLTDNGVGFDEDSLKTKPHLGLLGVRERAASVGGSARLESQKGGGACLFVEIPLAPDASA